MQPSARSAHRLGNRLQCFRLTDHPLGQSIFHVQQFIALGFQKARGRDARPAADDLGDHFFVHGFGQHGTVYLQLFEVRCIGFKISFRLGQFPVADRSHPF